jgi:lipopolysaccharide transport system ATP-binding protein
MLRAGNLRNDLEIFRFNPASAGSGVGNASITGVRFEGPDGQPYRWVVGGENVYLVIHAKASCVIASPILGFIVKNRLGQSLFGDNTYLTYADSPLSAARDTVLQARFGFRMPRLPIGEYMISAAIADGAQQQHVTLHWLHDALMFRSQRSSTADVLLGLPMLEISLTVEPEHASPL